MAGIFCYIMSFIPIYLQICDEDYITMINISNYDYPKPNSITHIYIPIMATTDLHGYAFPRSYGQSKYGGIALINAYLKALRHEWGSDRFIWLDAGDQFQGALESTISNGSVIADFFNYAGLDGSCLGNHEFDHGIDFLKEFMVKVKSKYITTNIKDKANNDNNDVKAPPPLPNSIYHKIIKTIKGIKIGIIGFTPSFSYFTTKEDVSKLNFKELKDVISLEAANLRNDYKVNAVVLLIHSGIKCADKSDTNTEKLRLHNISFDGENSIPNNCDVDSDLYQFLTDPNNNNIVDIVIGGHVHQSAQYFINSTPIVHSEDRGRNFNIVYLSFNYNTLQLDKSSIVIEGPIPVCSLISPFTHQCTYKDINDPMHQYSFHDYHIFPDKHIEHSILQPYHGMMSFYQKFVCIINTTSILQRSDYENGLGNLITDAIRNATNADVALLNNGAFRTNWYPGNIYVEQVFDMNPFKTIVFSFEMTGEEMVKMLKMIQTGPKKYYQTSGIRQYVKGEEIIKVEIINDDDKEVKPEGKYRIAMNDFLIEGGDDFKRVYDWYIKRNVKEHGKLTEIVVDYMTNKRRIEDEDIYENNVEKRRIVFVKDDNSVKGKVCLY